jgi:predicted GH43/DUF377 family glycosyl hydrolase
MALRYSVSEDRLGITRRSALAVLAAGAVSAEPPARYRTPYKLNRLVLGGSGVNGDFDSKAVDCPFVFRHAGRFYMTYVGFDGTGYQTGLASSDDLLVWKREGCILRRDPASPVTRYNVAMTWIVRDNAIGSAGSLKRIDGRFLGAYHAYPNAGYEQGPAVIGLCRSEDLHHWELEPPFLHAEEGAEWERGGLYKACLVEQSGTYYLFYNAKTPEKHWHEQTGVATSRDLKTWQRYQGNPILRNGTTASWDDRFASDPCVLRDGKRWLLFYFGLDSDGKARDLLATGTDPFHYTKSDEILIDVGPSGTVDSTYAHKPSVISHQGMLYHFYCAVSGKWPDETRGISVARSKPW